ncbi:MAG: ribosomal-protein-alanine N-acetyltransferase [Chloroflexi bacterium RBG_16_54_11]|nr:MAG: ribosomal-protein-alanine N-acetyltransferase [Chloroflexi bacterium RBG_16_54_11]
MMHPINPGEIDEPRFRLMKLSDIPRVHEIDTLSFSLPWPEKSFIFELTENPSTLALVAEVIPNEAESILVGMSVVWIIIDEAHIATIAMHPDFRGKGYGKRLLAQTLRQSIHRGVHLATLEVREGNQVAQQMYCSFGFKITGRREHYYRDNNEDAVVMTVSRLGPGYLAWMDKLEF